MSLITVPKNDLSSTLGTSIEFAIAAWLDSKSGLSHSQKTITAYRDTITDFRHTLLAHGYDLDSNATHQREIALIAQGWSKSSKTGRTVAPATINQRLAIVSSFFEYAARNEFVPDANPIRRIERAKVQRYAHAIPLDSSTVQEKLAAIERDTLLGKRDYALLIVALSTGRRLNELAKLRWGDVTITGNNATLTFVAKGVKTMRDTLSQKVTAVLMDYMHSAYGRDLDGLESAAPIWISASNRNAGKGISWQTIRLICIARLGVSKVHTLRHTFAHTMEQVGATPTEIQRRLGHTSLATTTLYLESLASSDNPYAEKLDAVLGL